MGGTTCLPLSRSGLGRLEVISGNRTVYIPPKLAKHLTPYNQLVPGFRLSRRIFCPCRYRSEYGVMLLKRVSGFYSSQWTAHINTQCVPVSQNLQTTGADLVPHQSAKLPKGMSSPNHSPSGKTRCKSPFDPCEPMRGPCQEQERLLDSRFGLLLVQMAAVCY